MGNSKGKSVQVLGMLRIADDGEVGSLALAHKPRTVLAMLVAHPDQVVSLPALVRELWGERPPASALRVVQTYILQARKALSQATRLPIKVIIEDALTTHAGGYMFSESFARLDYRIYQGLVDSGRKALANGDLSAGVSYLGDALGIWRGSAFADVVVGCFAILRTDIGDAGEPFGAHVGADLALAGRATPARREHGYNEDCTHAASEQGYWTTTVSGADVDALPARSNARAVIT